MRFAKCLRKQWTYLTCSCACFCSLRESLTLCFVLSVCTHVSYISSYLCLRVFFRKRAWLEAGRRGGVHAESFSSRETRFNGGEWRGMCKTHCCASRVIIASRSGISYAWNVNRDNFSFCIFCPLAIYFIELSDIPALMQQLGLCRFFNIQPEALIKVCLDFLWSVKTNILTSHRTLDMNNTYKQFNKVFNGLFWEEK